MSEQGNGIAIERGDLSPEDAERYAAAFRPVWELDEAPFMTPTPALTLSTQDIEVLTAPAAAAVMEMLTKTAAMPIANGVHAAIAAAAPAQFEARAPQTPQPAPVAQRTQPVMSRVPRTMPRSAAAVQRKSADFTDDLVLPKKSSGRGLLYGAIALGALVGVGLAVKFLGSDDSPHGSTPVAATTAAPPTPKEDTIPPPAPADPGTAQAPSKAVTADTPAAPDDLPKGSAQQTTGATAPPTTTHKADVPKPSAAHAPEPKHSPPPTPPPPKPATKSGSGGIVRDNPF